MTSVSASYDFRDWPGRDAEAARIAGRAPDGTGLAFRRRSLTWAMPEGTSLAYQAGMTNFADALVSRLRQAGFEAKVIESKPIKGRPDRV